MKQQHSKTKAKKNLPKKGKSKPRATPVDKPSEEDRAALDYEHSREKAAATQARAEQLTKLFLKTPAMVEHAEMIDAVHNRTDWTSDTVCIEVAKPLLAMLEFQERAEAVENGRAPEPLDKILARIVDNELQEELHWLAVAPAHFERYRNLWNRFCDEQGAPEHKIEAPEKTEARGGEGPF